jgi:hypothetical protein
MLSYILYGRNDSYGYNLHKRAAMSFNCLAEILSDPEDEILFVDYNTPNDFPTFPEAIADMLTEKTKRHLRTFRVRPDIHVRFAARTHLQTLEPVSRNIALRRSNPANRWILSTNTDMIFVPRQKRNLTEIVRDLPKGYYGLPRFELPESMWECLDRRDPRETIATVGRWGWRYHLNEVVATKHFSRFNAPGDFQLIERDDLFRIHGFHEEMLLGWAVDWNLDRRVKFLYKETGDIMDSLFGYHCNHLRQISTMHHADARTNNPSVFVYDVDRPDIPEQAETWGCPDDDIEEIRLSDHVNKKYISALDIALPDNKGESCYIFDDTIHEYDRHSYVPEHVIPFIMNVFSHGRKDINIAWLGMPGRMLDLFHSMWIALGFTGKIFIQEKTAPHHENTKIKLLDMNGMLDHGDIFIFDFSDGDGKAVLDSSPTSVVDKIDAQVHDYYRVISAEMKRRQNGEQLRRLIGINCISNRFEALFQRFVACSRSETISHIRFGYLAVVGKPHDWLKSMRPGEAGKWRHGRIAATAEMGGKVAAGPDYRPVPGLYRLVVTISCDPKDLEDVLGPQPASRTHAGAEPLKLSFQVLAGTRVLARKKLQIGKAGIRVTKEIGFEVPPDEGTGRLSVVITSNGARPFIIDRAIGENTSLNRADADTLYKFFRPDPALPPALEELRSKYLLTAQ